MNDETLPDFVRQRAGDCCEYCRLPQAFSSTRLQIDHILEPYLMARDDHFERAGKSGAVAVQNPVQQPVAQSRTESHGIRRIDANRGTIRTLCLLVRERAIPCKMRECPL